MDLALPSCNAICKLYERLKTIPTGGPWHQRVYNAAIRQIRTNSIFTVEAAVWDR